jgi:hypothetical protein
VARGARAHATELSVNYEVRSARQPPLLLAADGQDELRPGSSLAGQFQACQLHQERERRGVYFSRDPESDEQDFNNFLRGVIMLGLDEAIAKIFGRERGRLRTERKITVHGVVLKLHRHSADTRYNVTLSERALYASWT